MDLIQTLTELSATHGPAGSEYPVAALVSALLRPHMDEVTLDPLGSVIGMRKSGQTNAKRVLIEAHMDEVGFVVTGQKDGFLTLSNLGSIDPRHLPGTRLRVLTETPLVGVIACMPPHVLSASDMDKVTPLSDLVLDLGLSTDEASAIPLGTPVVYDTVPMPMGEGLFSGKAMDNRASIAAVLLALESLPKALDFDLFVLFSVQEELGMRGAQTAAYGIAPDIAVALDVTFAHTPDASPEQTVPLGSGAAIGVGPVLCRTLSEQLTSLAGANDIPHQFEILPKTTSTTADKLQISRSGVPTALISLPLRYMHSASELVALSDIEAVAALLTAFLCDLNGGEAYA